MTRWLKQWNEYWFRPRPLVDLAVCRMLWVGFQLYWHLFIVHVNVSRLGGMPAGQYNPQFAVRLLMQPFGGSATPPTPETAAMIWWATLGAGLLAFAGVATNVSLAGFAVGTIFLQALIYSFGDFHHPEAVVAIGLALLAFSPAGGALSVDAWYRFRRSAGSAAPPAMSAFAGWPLLVIQWVLGLIYLSGGVSKLTVAGWQWLNGHTMQYYLLQDGLRWERPLGIWLGQQFWAAWLLSFATLAFETGFILVMLRPWLARLFLPVGALFHVGIFVTMHARFFSFPMMYAAWVPWASLFRRLRRA